MAFHLFYNLLGKVHWDHVPDVASQMSGVLILPSDTKKRGNHHSSGWRPHPLGWGGKPAPIVKIQTRQNFEILSFCACGEAFPIQTVDRKQTFGVNT